MKSKNFETRYQAFKLMIEKYALLQFGLSFIRKVGDRKYKSVSFTFHTVCMKSYTVNPGRASSYFWSGRISSFWGFYFLVSMVFLAEHGLSLTDVYKRGIQFSPPEEGVEVVDDKLEKLWRKICSFEKPFVVHNGLADLMFIWRSFFGPLPSTVQGWIKVLLEVFPTIVDTKYLAEYVTDDQVTYLQYLFKNSEKRRVVELDCVRLPESVQVIVDQRCDDAPTEVCRQYAQHGNCRRGLKCCYSHDIDFIVHVEEARRLKQPVTMVSKLNNAVQRNVKRSQMSHSAGFDAVATGFVYASFLEKYSLEVMQENRNKLYLMWHDKPLLLVQSQWA